MLRQYAPQRQRNERIGNHDRAVGTIGIGTIFRIHDDNGLRRGRALIVEAWYPRCVGAGRRVAGRYADTFVARGGHLAQVRDLATGRRLTMADHHILRAIDA